jgi:tetratricopeptide (TPR) repeat protein
MSSQFSHDQELQSYFTDVEHLREMFKQWLAAPELPKRLLIIHGVGGVGKSSLLRMFRLHCKSVRVPVALASGDEQKSALDVLTRWTDDLTADGVALPAFRKTLTQYRALYLKVEDETKKMAEKLAKEAAKTLVETAASTIPGLGPLVGKLGGMGVEALTDWLFGRGFKKPDVDLLLDPAKKLSEDFLTDVISAASKQRLVLMLDTFEQIDALTDWTREVAQRLHANALLVIAGRAVPNWDRAWHGWMANAHIEELKPMTEENMRELVRRYYATIRGGEPDPKQVEAIIAFARGLPMVVTSAVQLWVRYGVEDFQAVKPEIVANLVDRLMEGVPRELAPALEAAAIVRWFDQPILRAVMQRDDVRDVYDELRRFPFVRTRAEGRALHDAVREIIDEDLRVRDAERHRELHERAAAYFEARLGKASGEEAERLALERLYHRVRADEETGIKLFQEMAEELARYRMVNRLRALLNDVNTYPLEMENSRLWWEYYNARRIDLAAQTGELGHLAEAEKVYQAISETERANSKLRAYAYHDWGRILRGRRIGKFDYLKKVIDCFERSLALAQPDYKLAAGLYELGPIYRDMGQWDKAFEYLNQAQDYYQKHNAYYDLVLVYIRSGWYYTYRGNWSAAFAMYPRCVELTHQLGDPAFLRMETSSWMGWFHSGRRADIEQGTRKAAEIGKEIGLVVNLQSRDMGMVYGFSDRFAEAEECFSKDIQRSRAFASYTRRDEAVALGFYGMVLVRKGEIDKAIEILIESYTLKRNIEDTSYLLETINWLGIAHETVGEWEKAHAYYRQNLEEYRWAGRLYFDCGALTGLVRVKHAQGEYAAIPPLLAEAEQLAQQYEYNDHLASLRLTQGHIALEGNAPAWENGFDAALRYYQHALIYALRYNRFLLDEVLSGRPQGTPLRPIIPECLKRGEEGRKMLIALRDWWKAGVNDIGTPRPDTISPIPEGIALLEAERIAREREPGDGLPQKSVVEQIDAAL